MSDVVQATVATWDPTGGTAVLDSGQRLDLDPDLLVDSVFRFVRPGQRVDLVLDGGVVTWLGLPGTAPAG